MNAYFPTNRVTVKRTEIREKGHERKFHYSHLPTHISFAPTLKLKEDEENNNNDNVDSYYYGCTKPTIDINPEDIKKEIETFRHKCGRFVNSRPVQNFIIVLIILNAITLGIATSPFVLKNHNVYEIFEIIDKIFLIIFTSELFLQFVYRGFYIFCDGWLIFDFTIIVISWACQALQVIRGLRAVRAFRVCRSLRLISRIRVMREIVAALLAVIPRMIAITILNSIVMYIFGVMFTMLFRDLYKRRYLSHDYFATLQDTIFTLFQLMTLDGWSEICREVMVAYKWAWIPFFSYVTVSAFIMINLVVAVVCDAIADLERAKSDGRSLGGSSHTLWSSVSVASDGMSQSHFGRSTVASLGHGTEEIKGRVDKIEEQVSLLARSQERTQDMADFLVKQIQSSRRRRRGGMNFLESR